MPAPRREFESIVIGLGAIGSAAAYWLARRKSDVLGLEQYEPGHDKGASEDHSRVIRLTYHTPHYVSLMHHAFAAWRELEAESGEQLLVRTGDLLLGPRQSAMPVTDYLDAMTAANLPFEHLDAAEIMYRWPQWVLDDDIHATFQPDGGFIAAGRGVSAHARMAKAYGAELRYDTPATRIAPVDGGVEITTPEGRFSCHHLVLAADQWTNRLLEPLGMSLPLTLMEEQVQYFGSPHLDEFTPDRFPVWIWADDPNFYGIPVYGEERGVKAAQDMAGREVTIDTRTFEPDPGITERVAEFLRRRLPRAVGPVVAAKTCISTLTPDRDFVVDTLPGSPRIAVALGTGHAYKSAGLIGQILADLVLHGSTHHDIAPFAFDRPVLHLPNPPRNFLLRREAPVSPGPGG